MTDDGEQLGLATEVTVAWLANPHTRAGAEDVSAMLGSVLTALRGLGGSPSAAPTEAAAASAYTPAVTPRRSLASPDHILSMIDGKPYRSLTRHLRTHRLTPAEYRERYGLKADYPMVAPTYSAVRSAAAKQHRFGRKPAAEASPEPAAEAATTPATSAKRGRLSISGAKQAAQAHLSGGEDAGASGSEAE